MSKKITRGNSEEFRENWGTVWDKQVTFEKEIAERISATAEFKEFIDRLLLEVFKEALRR